MTTTPPSSPDDDSILPPRHRPRLDKIVEDSTEMGLWAFDDLNDPDEKPQAAPVKSRAGGIPAPRNRDKFRTQELSEPQPEKKDSAENQVRVNVGTKKKTPSVPSTPQSVPGAEFADLDHWEEADLPVSRPEDYVPLPSAGISVAAMPVAPKPEPEVEVKVEPPLPQVAAADDFDEFSPAPRPDATPISLRPHLKLSKIERIGLWGLFALLLIGGVGVIIFSLARLPTSSSLVKSNDFPIAGKLITVETANSYWREPITDGLKAETFRRGTQLLPVVSLTTSRGPAAVRVFFRNGDRELVGDAVTRTIEAGSTLEVAATAGFEDVGMHAAYRTGQTMPWTIEIHEGTSVNSPSSEFNKVFEMSISTDRR